jgi:ATP-binding protein involved in chromosome partitioning
MITQEQILAVLRNVKDPEKGKDLLSLGMIKEALVQGNDISLEVVLSSTSSFKDKITEDIRLALRSQVPGVGKVDVRFSAETRAPQQPQATAPQAQKPRLLANIKNVIAVGSGKGGVGKSTVAVNLALALKQEGKKVGILDADIYGPSIPIMCGVKEGEKPKIAEGNRIIPIVRFGMPLMSMGFLMGAGDAVVWRGPMLSKMLQQFLEQVEWGNLDYLIIDLPPGTGDVQLSLAQLIPMSGAVVVTTPQDVAFADVIRAIKMFQLTKVPLLGIVENMSSFECPHCHKESTIFGHGEDHKGRYKNLDLPLLGRIPLEIETRIAGDEGTPIVERKPKSPQAEQFRKVVQKLMVEQHLQGSQKGLELPSLQ